MGRTALNRKAPDPDSQTSVAAYLRVSTDGQEQGNGLDVQRQHIVAYAAANRITVDRWLQDVESGAKEGRPALDELRGAVAAGGVGTVLVYRVDRLARDLLLAEQLHRELSSRAHVISVSEHFGEGFTGNLMRQIVSAFAEYERAVIAARLRGGRKEAARKKGTSAGGPRVFGYASIGSRSSPGKGMLRVVRDEANTVRTVFTLRAQGWTLDAIAQNLNSRGRRTAKNRKFTAVQVHRILSREAFYRGQAVLARSYESGATAHEPILK